MGYKVWSTGDDVESVQGFNGDVCVLRGWKEGGG